MSAVNTTAPRVVVVGSGPGGAAAAMEFQKTCRVTILEAGGEFKPLSMSIKCMEILRRCGLLFDERLIQVVFPSMRVRKTRDGMIVVSGMAAGGTTGLFTANALRMDRDLRDLGIDLDDEFNELCRELPISTAHREDWNDITRRLFAVSEAMGLDPEVTPKLTDDRLCRRCGRCILGCRWGAKWDSRRFLDEAVRNGAELRCGHRVTKVVIRDGRAIGVLVRSGYRQTFIPADLVVLAAGGMGTPDILEKSGIGCEPRLFVDPVLCVAAPWPRSRQFHEIPMPFIIQREGYIVSPYFDFVSFLFNRKWRYPAERVLGLMIKLADTGEGRTGGGHGLVDKVLSEGDRKRLSEAETLCRDILTRFGVSGGNIFTGTINAGHPGGMVPLTSADVETLHPARLPENIYVADASLFPRSLGNPPVLTILALSRRVARKAVTKLSASA